MFDGMTTSERHRIATRIREVRRASGLSQERFAAKLGFYRRTVERWEAGTTLPDRRGREALAAESGKSASFFGEPEEEATAAATLGMDEFLTALVRREIARVVEKELVA